MTPMYSVPEKTKKDMEKKSVERETILLKQESFQVRDEIWVVNHNQRKLDPGLRGQGIFMEVKPNNTYLIKELNVCTMIPFASEKQGQHSVTPNSLYPTPNWINIKLVSPKLSTKLPRFTFTTPHVSQPIPESGWTPKGEAGWAWKAMYAIDAIQTR
ncbi:hypothetical protein DSO57_1004557 [Entomophthora muscae]|uniref:Uncharacterized protein n=1 Tax=Entomophthora muscae TaxID=34485 RepID=A0ACC2SAB7_9FUNG|nr:hypothetical protein DSO57_1004557 [Entomophthora muscae]